MKTIKGKKEYGKERKSNLKKLKNKCKFKWEVH
jgi:hypothetical protein